MRKTNGSASFSSTTTGKQSIMLPTNKSKQISYLLLPDWWEFLGLLVITSKTVDSALHKNQPELGVLILSVPFQMLPN